MELRHLKSEAREATKLLEDKKVLEVKVRLVLQQDCVMLPCSASLLPLISPVALCGY